MCGRYSLSISLETIEELFGFHPAVDSLTPRYNIAPTQTTFIIRRGREGTIELAELRWGLIPRWSKDAAVGSKMINARSETVAEKPAFRDAFRKRRCLIPASGFFEWKTIDDRTKQPFYVQPADHQPLVMAGLWESWLNQADGKTIESFAILTTHANLTMQFLHHRMPVILHQSQFSAWLDCDSPDLNAVQSMLRPAKESSLVLHPVSRLVNSPGIDLPALIEPESAGGLKPGIPKPSDRFRQQSLFD
jgi:putative SOS response-associated peptidase YedK